MATVDVPGVIISIPWRPCKHGLYHFGCNQMFYIGLLTDAVFISAWALTLSVRLRLGNARASVRGIDNRTIPRFFVPNSC